MKRPTCRASNQNQEPTPPEVFFNRRQFVAAVGMGAVAATTINCARAAAVGTSQSAPVVVPFERPAVFPAKRNEVYKLPNAEALTPREVAATHNNFYEFLPGRGGPVWQSIGDFEVDPWKVEITGECHKPKTFDLDDIFKFPHEERLYHFRCVERWAMNVPWSGFPMRKLLEAVEPKSTATHVRFLTANKPAQMPGIKNSPNYPWPYHEGLRIEEAMNDVCMAVTGVYGEPLLKQHGSPIRCIVPWKYGYKSPKSIVKIELVREEPKTFWQVQPHEYGFLSNVNPNIPHPRWSQAHSYWLGSNEPFVTQMFNGYEEYVASLYPDEPRTAQKALRAGQVAR